MSLKDRIWHRRLPEFESFDRIELQVVPRYKTSGMSGDEWRQHVSVKFYFKGEVVHETGWNGMRNALALLPGEWIRAQEPIPNRVIALEHEGKCDQPSCAEQAVGRFKLKRLTADNGDYLDMSEQHLSYYRQFCRKHLRRGDCGREDADDNYEPMDGIGPDSSSNVIESPSAQVVVHVDSLDEIPGAIEAARRHAQTLKPREPDGEPS